MSDRTKPTRQDLLRVLGRLQTLVGNAIGTAHNDRAPNRLANLVVVLEEAHNLCIDAQGYEDPVIGPSKHGWNFGPIPTSC